MTQEKVIPLADVEGTIEMPFVLKFARSGSSGANGSTNVFEDTAAAIAGIEPASMPAGETIGTTGSPGETADTTFTV